MRCAYEKDVGKRCADHTDTRDGLLSACRADMVYITRAGRELSCIDGGELSRRSRRFRRSPIDAGTVQQKRTGLLAVIAAFFAGLVDLVSVFPTPTYVKRAFRCCSFSTLLSPTAHSNLQKRVTSYPGSGSRQSGGRSGGGPRITGIDKINGPSGSAACPSGG
ncbi:hypothetical protein QJQ45_028740 [Haematococcus lacustris]|nr:hypothetical protein QJQ45_028740 [Haematococcus lacustris]